MSTSRYLRSLPHPPALTQIHYDLLRLLSKEPLTTKELAARILTSSSSAATSSSSPLSLAQPEHKIPTTQIGLHKHKYPIRWNEHRLALKWKKIEPFIVKRTITKTFIQKRILKAMERCGAIMRRRVTKRISMEEYAVLQERMAADRGNRKRMIEYYRAQVDRNDPTILERKVTITDKHAWFVNWNKFPSIAARARKELNVEHLPIAPPLSGTQVAGLKAKLDKEKRTHFWTTRPWGGKRPARRRNKIWQFARQFNRRGRRYFHLSGMWGKGEPRPKAAYN